MVRRGPLTELKVKLRLKGELGKKEPIFPGLIERVREERKMRAKSFLPRSTKFYWLVFVGLRKKVHRVGEGYAWVPKTRDFAKDPNEKFGKSKVLGL